jgi:hypothetical protein
MNNVKRLRVEVKEEEPQLHVVAMANGAPKRTPVSAPLFLRSPIHTRRPRPELAVLGWHNRATRLGNRK